jgi:hypothetical protein
MEWVERTSQVPAGAAIRRKAILESLIGAEAREAAGLELTPSYG